MKSTPPPPSREGIWTVFNQISSSYDRTNRVISLGMDQRWRKKLASFLPERSSITLLDCATGTGDQIIALMESVDSISSAIGIDLAEEMVRLAQEKMHKKEYDDKVSFKVASALEIPFPDESFDCVTISFGIRNVTDVMLAFKEFQRVLKPGGRLLILEGTMPRQPWLRSIHLCYLRRFLPYIGRFLSKHPSAYQYLNQTIETFPQGEKLMGRMRAAGFMAVKEHHLFGGVATIYQGDRSDHSIT